MIGVDTHKHSHTAAVVSSTGGVLGGRTVASTDDDYHLLIQLAGEHPGRRAWALEGTASYGAGLARFLRQRGEQVIEVDRPRRTARRMGAKSDPIDAARAARRAGGRPARGAATRWPARCAGRAPGGPPVRGGCVLVGAAPAPGPRGHHARAAAGQAARTEHAVAITACGRLRRSPRAEIRRAASIVALRALAKRIRALEAEAREHERGILAIVREWRPDLLGIFGIGPIGAAVILCAWSHAGRIRSDAAFAMLAGSAPIPASSGQVVRHRLNRFGDRQLNRALHVVVMHRIRHDPTTQAYVSRRVGEGKTRTEIRRCLTRYVARQVFRQLEAPPQVP